MSSGYLHCPTWLGGSLATANSYTFSLGETLIVLLEQHSKAVAVRPVIFVPLLPLDVK